MCAAIPIPKCVAGGQKPASFTQIDAKVTVGLIMRATVSKVATSHIFKLPRAQTRRKHLNLVQNMRILPRFSLATGSQIEQGSVFIEIVLVLKFADSSLLSAFERIAESRPQIDNRLFALLLTILGADVRGDTLLLGQRLHAVSVAPEHLLKSVTLLHFQNVRICLHNFLDRG